MRRVLIITILFTQVLCFCQTPIECYLDLAKAKEFLVQGDTIKAISFFENLPKSCDAQIGSSQHYNFAKLLQKTSPAKAKIQIYKAIDKGLLEWSLNSSMMIELLKELKEEYGTATLEYAIVKHDSLLQENSKEIKDLDKSLSLISDYDQYLRRNKENKVCSKYYYKWANGNLAVKSENHDELISRALEISKEDSLNLLKAIDLFIENPKLTQDNTATFKWSTPLINHMSGYNFETNIDSFFLIQITKGNLSPKTYAWYEGEKSDINKIESKYFFTKTEKELLEITNKDEIERINNNRREIGLPDLPATLWKHGSN